MLSLKGIFTSFLSTNSIAKQRLPKFKGGKEILVSDYRHDMAVIEQYPYSNEPVLLVCGEPGHDIILELYFISGKTSSTSLAADRSAFQHTESKLILDIEGIKTSSSAV
jgi:hypothetical protein